VKVRIVIHAAEEGGFWGEVPALPGVAVMAATPAEVITRLRDAIQETMLSPEIPAGGRNGHWLDIDM
jgi:predicted RNase H-like HicB family nuclease